MIKVIQEVDVYEVDGEDAPVGKEIKVGVASHWNRNQLVVLVIGKKQYTVLGSDLKTAIENAENTE